MNDIYDKMANLETPSVLDEARAIVNGDRNKAYGKPEESFTTISNYWETYLGIDISPKDVAMMMILLKVARNEHKAKRDNLVDICGYAACAEKIMNAESL